MENIGPKENRETGKTHQESLKMTAKNSTENFEF